MTILIPLVRGWLIHESLHGVGWVAPEDYTITKPFLPMHKQGSENLISSAVPREGVAAESELHSYQ